MADPKGNAIFEQAMASMMGEDAKVMAEQSQGDNAAVSNEMMVATMEAMPIRQLISFVPGVTKEALNQLIMALND